jgi:hypothetical protein
MLAVLSPTAPPGRGPREGTGGVGADEFDLDAGTLAQVAAAILVVLFVDGFQHRVPGGRTDEEIDEARSGDFCVCDDTRWVIQVVDENFGDFSRRHALGLGHLHGHVGGQIAVTVGLGLFYRHLTKIR